MNRVKWSHLWEPSFNSIVVTNWPVSPSPGDRRWLWLLVINNTKQHTSLHSEGGERKLQQSENKNIKCNIPHFLLLPSCLSYETRYSQMGSVTEWPCCVTCAWREHRHTGVSTFNEVSMSQPWRLAFNKPIKINHTDPKFTRTRLIKVFVY